MKQKDILSWHEWAQEQSESQRAKTGVYVSVNHFFENKMKTHGYMKVGSGFYGSVWMRGGDYYKINSNVNGPNDGFYAWMTACMEVEDNPALPRFFGAAQLGDRYCVKLERLTPQEHINCAWSLFDQIGRNDDLADAVLLALKVSANCCANNNSKLFSGDQISDITLSDLENRLDIHSGNIMSRGGVLVLNDPIARLGSVIVSEGVDNASIADRKAA